MQVQNKMRSRLSQRVLHSLLLWQDENKVLRLSETWFQALLSDGRKLWKPLTIIVLLILATKWRTRLAKLMQGAGAGGVKLK